VPADCWQLLVKVVVPSLSAAELRSDVIQAAEVAGAYIDRRLFSPLKRYPWCLAVGGNVEANIYDLWDLAEPPEDDTAARIWRLGQLGVNLQMLVRAVVLMRQCRFSTITVEQLHGTMSAIHRYHPMYVDKTLAMRALLSTVKQLLPDVGVDRADAARSRRMSALVRKQPRRISGYGLYCGSWLQQFKQQSSPSTHLSLGFRMAAMKAASREWSTISAETQMAWSQKADRQAEANMDSHIQDVAHERSRELIDFMRSQGAEQSQAVHGLVVRISTCRLTEEDFVQLRLMMDEVPPAEIRRRREVASKPPGVPPDAARDMMTCLGDLAANLDSRLPAGLPWERLVALAREHFANCVLVFWTIDRSRFFLFRYALKNPIFVGLSPLLLSEGQRPCGDALSTFRSGEPFDWVWRVQTGEYVHSYDLQDTRGEQVLVIPAVVAWHRHHLASHARPMRLEAFVHGLALKAASAAPGRKRARYETDDLTLSDRFPWTRRWFDEGRDGDSQVAGVRLRFDEVDLTEEQIDDVTSHVEALRKQWHSEHGDGEIDFVCELTGGPWAKAHLGVDVDGVRAKAKRWAETFCRKYHLGMSASFSFQVYGERLANVLALELAARMQWLYNWQSDGDAAVLIGHSFTDYVACSAFVEACAKEPQSNRKFHQRAAGVCGLKPRL
jgi:hypothetical protein